MLIRYLRCRKKIITLTLLIVLAVSFVDGQTITISVNSYGESWVNLDVCSAKNPNSFGNSNSDSCYCENIRFIEIFRDIVSCFYIDTPAYVFLETSLTNKPPNLL